MAAITSFLYLTRRAGVSEAALAVFWNETDLKALGVHARENQFGFSAMNLFIDLANCSDISDIKQRRFFSQLDFEDLGKKACKEEISFTQITIFLNRIRQSGVGEEAQRLFCKQLDFKALGDRATKDSVGFATITSFLGIVGSIKVSVNTQREFFSSLDLAALGKKVQEDEVGFPTVLAFLNKMQYLASDEAQQHRFYDELDFRKLAKSVINENDRYFSPTNLFGVLTRIPGVTREKALHFVEGSGWERIKRACSFMAPDALAAMRIFFRQKCELTAEELAVKGLTWTYQDWLHSFINNPCYKGKRVSKSRYGLFRYAWKGLLQDEDTWSFLNNEDLTLRSWNILIHNLQVAGLNELDEKVLPALRGMSTSQLETLVSKADLENIGLFLEKFNPKDGIFPWQFPESIKFDKINFLAGLKNTSLTALAYFLFNFYYIGQSQWAHYFADQLHANADQLLTNITSADLKALDLFTWNWFIALSDGQKPSILENPTISRQVIEKAKEGSEAHLLGIVGTMKLSGCSIPEFLPVTLNIDASKRICQQASDKHHSSLIRYLGGLWAKADQSLSVPEKRGYLRSLHKLRDELILDIPNQHLAIKKLTHWLSGAFARKKR
ncbi:MAG: hypothetical protein H6628_19630 [Calditrichae bacterium]|nr:hypothetical protein [Calditrichia bacterium]